MLSTLVNNYLELNLDYRKAVARKQSLLKMKATKEQIKVAHAREREISETIISMRRRILLKREPFDKKSARAFASIVVDMNFDISRFIPQIKQSSDEILFDMIREVDSSLEKNQVLEIIEEIRKLSE